MGTAIEHDFVVSNRQRSILRFIANPGRPYPPTVREIGTAVGLSSSASVHYHLVELERNGFIRGDIAKARTWLVTPKGMEVLADG